jgi:hypothetical protein
MARSLLTAHQINATSCPSMPPAYFSPEAVEQILIKCGIRGSCTESYKVFVRISI